MQALRIAFRNTTRNFRRNLLLGSAIGFGMMVIVSISSITNGLLYTVSSNISDLIGGHVYIDGEELSEAGKTVSIMKDTKSLETALKSIEGDIKSHNIRSLANTEYVFASKSETGFVAGIDFENETKFLTSIELISGDAEDIANNLNSIILPEKTADALLVDIGESIIVKSETATGQPNIMDFVVRGISKDESRFGSSSYGHLATVNELLNIENDEYQSYNIFLEDLNDAPKVAEKVHAALAELAPVKELGEVDQSDGPFGFDLGEEEDWEGTRFSVLSIQDLLSELIVAFNVVRRIAWGIFGFVLVIIMVGIMNSYRMVMIERTPEIGTMRAMGVQKAGIRNIFIWEAFFVGIGGVVIGLLLFLLIKLIFNIVTLPTENDLSFFLKKGHLVFLPSFWSILGNIAIVCLISVLAVLIPARAAANLSPADALRS